MFEDKTHLNLKNEMLINADLPIAKNEGSILDSIFSSTALAHAGIYTVLDKILNIAFIKDSYGDNLDKRVQEFGVIRKDGEMARGHIKVTGKKDTVLPDGMKFEHNNKIFEFYQAGEKLVKLTGETDENSATIFIQAVSPGAEYNIPSGSIFKLIDDIEGVESAISVGAIENGVDPETDDELKERFFYLQAHKGTSGNVDDYINWALSVDGVKNVKVIPLWNGNGTVKVIVMSKNNRNVTPEIVDATKRYIETKRPIGASVTVTTPTILDINITATVEVDDNYTLDQVKEGFIQALDDYLVKSVKEITYTKVAGLLVSTEGVIDFSNLTINGTIRNIKLVTDQVGAVGNITLTKGVID